MKSIKLIILSIAVLVSFTSCDEYLTRNNLDSFNDANYWTSEDNVRLFAQGNYTAYFQGYGRGYTWGPFFTGSSWSDEYISGSIWTANTAASGNGWSFTYVRKANYFLNRIQNVPMSDEAMAHWTGIGRFFRAMEYSDLAWAFGDMPFYDTELFPNTDPAILYKDRDDISVVVDNIIADYEFAANNVRANDGAQQINKYVVLAMMSRDLLHLGTLMKYHGLDANGVAQKAIEKSYWASEQIMNSGKFQIVDDYRGIFTSEDLGGNKEVILYRQYADAKVTHCLVSYQWYDSQTGASLDMLNSYLSADGLPIKQSPVYDYAKDNNLRAYEEMALNRDPRMIATFNDTTRINKLHSGYSTTGACCWKFLPYDANLLDSRFISSTNTADSPVLRYGEVLLNYAEAAYELGKFNQTVADATINVLRNRNIKKNNQGEVYPKLPKMVLDGSNVTADGVVINDPDRDPEVDPIRWEIMRERRVELIYENNLRRADLKRWKKYHYLVTSEAQLGEASPISLGTYVDLDVLKERYLMVNTSKTEADFIKDIESLNLYDPISKKTIDWDEMSYPDDFTKAYLYPGYNTLTQREWDENDSYYTRQYFSAVPIDQIKLYKDLGYKLTQNPGWDDVE